MRWILLFFVFLFLASTHLLVARSFEVKQGDPTYIDYSFFNSEVKGGDTIFINPNRLRGIVFYGFAGDTGKPIVITNNNGLVSINDSLSWSGIQLKNCKYIKLSGAGSENFRYGLKLAGSYSGVNVSNESSNIEIEFVEIDHEGFAGIQVKDDYGGKPPSPTPVFKELVIHDCFIQNVSEGMYLGETKSPGLEFRYVRIFNNVVINTGREGIQLANMVEDVEVYNNFISNSGVDLLPGQGNNIQIGDNTVADIYNNVLTGASEFGVIVFGMGHINIYSNYFENSNGVFIDNRKFTQPYSSIQIRNNYFLLEDVENVILNYNEKNEILISDNQYQGAGRFYRSNCDTCSNSVLSSNIEIVVSFFNFNSIDDGFFTPSTNNPIAYQPLGPTLNQTYVFNSWPELDNLKDVYVNVGSEIEYIITTFTHDGDSLELTFDNLPTFISLTEIENGKVRLLIDAKNQTIGIYSVMVAVRDKSHRVEIRKVFNIVVKAADNHPPQIEIDPVFEFNNLEKYSIPFSVFDADGDALEVELLDAADFIQLHKSSPDEYVLMVSPGYSDVGDFNLKIKVDDGFSGMVEAPVLLHILPKHLEPGVVLYRFNLGGPALEAEPINWLAGNDMLYVNTEQKLHNTGGFGWKGTNLTNAPDSLFGPFSFIKPDSQMVQFTFQCEPSEYQVNLYFTQRQMDFDSIGATKMQVFAEGEMMENVTIGADFIDKAMVKSFKVEVADSLLEINLVPIQNFVKINGLEISVAFPFHIDESVEAPIVFPNPFSETLFIVNDEQNPVDEWFIYNLAGQLKVKGTVQNYYLPFIQIDDLNFESGLYIIEMLAGSGVKTQKIIRR